MNNPTGESVRIETVQEKAEYAKFKNRDVHEIYHRYLSFFGQAFDSDKYAITPTKLSQRGIDGVINSSSDSPHDTLPINVEARNSSDEGPVQFRSFSRMDISGCHSGEKRKGSARRSKGKAKKIGSVDLSYSVEHLASVGEALAASRQISQ
ncbi:L10-interacting MYB domain-containing protein-like [Forsythia ovata]|uniref:L10-interacting MYB domain-containing protein-like n=1 Tax=Forsythia ovata TaxID=205694 RepID=A0ABD1RJ87_9LAMI